MHQALERLHEIVALGLALERHPDRRDLPGEELRLGRGPRVGFTISLDLMPVTVGLAVAAHRRYRHHLLSDDVDRLR